METKIYGSCDRAIKAMDRQSLNDFGRLKMAKWDEINIVRTVQELYRKSAQYAERQYFEVAFEAYILGLIMCGEDAGTAHKKAWDAITGNWVRGILEETDFVTLYRFDTETERKAQRLIEALSAIAENRVQAGQTATNRNLEIDKALRSWTGQLAQYAINVTDYAVIQAFEDAGAEGAFWVTAEDERVCVECRRMNGKWFPVDAIPAKPHLRCRCTLRPGDNPDRDAD